MCQLAAECPGNNRCDSDNSTARRNRRKSAAAKQSFKDFIRLPANIPTHKPNILRTITNHNIKRQVEQINNLIPDTKENVMDVETKHLVTEKLIALGDKVKALAESTSRAYPAPVQEDFDAAFARKRKKDLARGMIRNYQNDKEQAEKVLQGYGYDMSQPVSVLKSLVAETTEMSNEQKESWRKYFSSINGIKEQEKVLSIPKGQFHDVPTPEELYKWRRAAIIDTLKEIGVEFSEGNLLYAPSITENDYLAAQHLTGAATLYPKVWVENSDKAQLEERQLLHPKGIEFEPDEDHPDYDEYYDYRAEYAEDVQDNFPKAVPEVEYVEKDGKWVSDPYTKEGNENMILTGVTKDGKSIYKKDSYQYLKPYENSKGEIVNPRPAGWGWEQIELYEDDNNPAKGKITYWRSRLFKNTDEVEAGKRDVVKNQPFIDKMTGKYGGESVAAHEFFHRLTDTNPKLRQMQMAFLHTRAKLGSQQEESPTCVFPAEGLLENPELRDEVGYPHTFNVGYAGREYSDWDNEVGTMGFEALYFGEHGGFMQSSEDIADPQYYSFMLGLLASSIKKE